MMSPRRSPSPREMPTNRDQAPYEPFEKQVTIVEILTMIIMLAQAMTTLAEQAMAPPHVPNPISRMREPS